MDGWNRDIEATARCLVALGARIAREEDGIVRVHPICRHLATTDEATLDCGESGSTLRFLLPVACALGRHARFLGSGRLPERPNGALVEALRRHGAEIDASAPPMHVRGKLHAGVYEMPGNVSSQYISGLLFALPTLDSDGDVALTTELESASYVQMTCDALSTFGIQIETTARGWHVPGRQVYRAPAHLLTIEGDWSAAAFFLAANRLGSDVRVTGLSERSAQGDAAVYRFLGEREIDAQNVPDLVPALAVAATARPGRTVIRGAARLRLKESDRISSTVAMIRALGGNAGETGDGLWVEGGVPLDGGIVDGRNDHRIVMAAAILATSVREPVVITDAEAVKKSYPDFFEHFNALGGHAHVESLR